MWEFLIGLLWLVCLAKSDSNAVLEEFDDFYSNDEFRYRSHRDIKMRYRLLNRDSFPISEASYSTAQLSPSKEVYSIPFNEETVVLLTVRNNGRKQFNITHLACYLHAAHSFDFLVENYTERVLNVGVMGQTEITLEYRFEPWNGLSTVDYVLSCDAGYILPLTAQMDTLSEWGDAQFIPFQTQFANVTIAVYDSAKLFDFQLLFMWMTIFIVLVVAAIVVYEMFYVPNQTAKGNQVPSTLELLSSLYEEYLPSMSTNSETPESPRKNVANTRSDRPSKSSSSDWLSGTAIGGSKSKQKKSKKKKQ